MKKYKVPFYADKHDPYQSLMLQLSKKYINSDFAQACDDLLELLNKEGVYQKRGSGDYSRFNGESAVVPKYRKQVEELVERVRETSQPVQKDLIPSLVGLPQEEMIDAVTPTVLASQIFGDYAIPTKIKFWKNTAQSRRQDLLIDDDVVV